MENKNEKLEAIRGEIPFKIKEQVDAWFDAIDRAYELGCRDTEQKLNLSGIGSKRLLEDLDTLLAYLEDTAHGEEGKRITEMRGRVQAACASGGEGKGVSEGVWLIDDGHGNKIKPGQA